MMEILTRSGDMALWFDIVHDAEASCAISLQTEIESYLVFLLMRHLKRTDLASQILAKSFLEAMQASRHLRTETLRSVGDQCLLFAGLYPEVAKKRHVRPGYFVDLGQAAYSAGSLDGRDLYAALCREFVAMMDVLQSVRHPDGQIADLLPVDAFELWSDTGSKRALAQLRLYTNAIPVSPKRGREI